MPASERLLILGATGFLGQHLVRQSLGCLNLEIGVGARRPGLNGMGLAELDSGPKSRLHPLELNISEPDAINAVFRAFRPTKCILAAARSRLEDCEEQPEQAQRTNAHAPGLVAELAQESGVRLVHVSTDLVFGGSPPRSEGYREGDSTGAISVYGQTKAAGERRVLGAYPGALVCRLPLLFGESQGRGLGASEQLLKDLAQGKRPALFTDEWRSPLDVEDAARALLELAGCGTQVGGGKPEEARGILHVAGPGACNRFEFGIRVLAAQGHSMAAAEAALVPTTRAATGLANLRPADVSLDSRRARALLATPLRSLDEALGRPFP